MTRHRLRAVAPLVLMLSGFIRPPPPASAQEPATSGSSQLAGSRLDGGQGADVERPAFSRDGARLAYSALVFLVYDGEDPEPPPVT